MNLLQKFKELDGVKVKMHDGLYICTYSNFDGYYVLHYNYIVLIDSLILFLLLLL